MDDLTRARDMIDEVVGDRSIFPPDSRHAAAMVRSCLYVSDPRAALEAAWLSPITSVQERAWVDILLNMLNWTTWRQSIADAIVSAD